MRSLIANCARAAAIFAGLTVTALAQDAADLQWQQYAFDNQDGARTHLLSFAIPETDAWLFNAECRAGHAGPAIPVMLALDFGSRENGDDVEVRFRTETYDATFAGKVSIQGEEYAGIAVEVGVGDAFWPALRRGNVLHSGLAGEHMRLISLRGSNDPVRRFVESCSQIFAEASSSAAPAPDGAHAYECENGRGFDLTIDTSRPDPVATITSEGNSATLVQVPGESGTVYAKEPLEMRIEGDVVLMVMPQETVRCTRRD